MSIFSHSQDQADINNIGRVVCQEFGFKKLDMAHAVKTLDLKSQFEDDAEYDDFLENKSITGIKCTGTEKSVKDCKNVHDSTDLFEVEIECSCNEFIFCYIGFVLFCIYHLLCDIKMMDTGPTGVHGQSARPLVVLVP